MGRRPGLRSHKLSINAPNAAYVTGAIIALFLLTGILVKLAKLAGFYAARPNHGFTEFAHHAKILRR